MTAFSPSPMPQALPTHRAQVLADRYGGTIAREGALILGATAFIALLSQIAIPLGFTPVPLSLGTLAVLITGASLGPVRAITTTTLYLLAGVAGAPIFADGGSGWQFASFGYIAGYIGAAAIVGELSRRRADRHFLRTIALGTAGTVVIYAAGVPWLMASTGADLITAWHWGVAPFLIGDSVKILITALILPSTWHLVKRFQR